MLQRTIAIALACALLTLPSAEAQAPFMLLDGTPVKLRLTRNLTSATAREGDTVDLELVEDIRVNDVVVALHGSPAMATITLAKSRGRMGKGGKLDINIDYVRLVNGEKASLRAVREGSGSGNSGKMAGAMVATSLIALPAAPFFLLMKGKDVTIPKGTEINAYLNGDVRLDPARFNARSLDTPNGVAAAGANTASGGSGNSGKSGNALTNTDVMIMKQAGLSDSLILAKIKQSPAKFSLEPTDMMDLKKKGVSDLIIQAMLEAQR